MTNAFQYRMPYGVPGDLSRGVGQATVEPQAFNQNLPFLAFGIPGKMANGLFVPVAASGDAVYGFLARPFPTKALYPSDPLGSATPYCGPGRQADVMVRGYMTVYVAAGTAANLGAVYVRYANGTTGTPIGGVEATSVSGSNVAIPNAMFMGPADPQGNAEIRFNI